MKIDGINLTEGSTITNLSVATGINFPINANVGEMFYRTDGGNVGLYFYDGSTWNLLSASGVTPWSGITGTPTTLSGYGITNAQILDSDLTAIAALTGTTGNLRTDGAGTWSVDSATYAVNSGVVHNTGTETIAGAKTFTSNVLISGTNLTITGATNPSIELGRVDGTASTPFIDFHAGTTTVDYDTRILCNTGTGVIGAGDLLYYAGNHQFFAGGANTVLKLSTAVSAVNYFQIYGGATGNSPTLSCQGSDTNINLVLSTKGNGAILFYGSSARQFEVGNVSGAVNNLRAYGATTGNAAVLDAVGADTNIAININSKGTSPIAFFTGGYSQARIMSTVNSVNYLQLTGAVTSGAPLINVNGSDTNIGLNFSTKGTGTMTFNGSGFTFNGGNVIIPTGFHVSLADAPVSGTDAVNKNYVDGNLAGLSWKNSVKTATTANITLSGTQTIDGYSVIALDRVLVKDQTTSSENGIYVASASAWSRATDMDSTTPINEVNSAAVFVENGTVQQDTGWTQINPVSVLGTDAVSFTQFNGAAGITAGVGLLKTGNVLDINLGAGISQLPSDEVGIDVHASGGLMTSVDNSASSTLTGAQLALTNVGTAGTYKSVTTDAKGRVTAGTNPTTLSGFGITDATTKTYVDDQDALTPWKIAVTIATTANITLSGTQTIDGLALSVGRRVLVKDQTVQSQNGIYNVQSGAWTRSLDMGTNGIGGGIYRYSGAVVFVNLGTINAQSYWALPNGANITVDTDPIIFVPFISGLSTSGNKNFIINGNFDIWQRGTTQTGLGYLSVDRWYNHFVGSTQSVSQQVFTLGQTVVPNDPRYFYRNIVTSVADPANTVATVQYIEGVKSLAGKLATVSFWAKANASKNISVELYQSFGTGGTPSSPVTGSVATNTVQKFALTTSWQKFYKTFSVPSIAGKTLGTNNDDYLALMFHFEGGSNFNTRNDTLGQQSGTFDIVQVKLEEGNITTNWVNEPLSKIVLDCQRYYQIYGSLITSGYNAASALLYDSFMFSVTMRKTPSITFSSQAYSNASALGLNFSSNTSFMTNLTVTATGAAYCTFTAALNAEI